MGIFNFWTKRPLEKNYLRIYGNIGEAEYSEERKKELVELLVNIANELNDYPKLNFDINGIGYGISKGSPFLGERAFRDKIQDKGYSKLIGATIRSEKGEYNSCFNIITWSNDVNWLNLDFSWNYFDDINLNKSIMLLKRASKIIKIDYAYAYSSDSSLSDSGEWRVSKRLFTVSSKMPKKEILWNKNIGKIKSGLIKKLYPINLFNEEQKKNLVGVVLPEEEIKLNDNITLWRFKSNSLQELNSKVSNSVLN